MKHTGPPFSIRRALQGVYHNHPHQHQHQPQHQHHVVSRSAILSPQQQQRRREFHDYFVTHLPSTSQAPDRLHPSHHKLPRSDSQPHSGPANRSSQLPLNLAARDTTVVRIPLKSAKHHYGVGVSRGSRPYNEDTYQAGTLEIPAFAKKQPVSISRRSSSAGDGSPGDASAGNLLAGNGNVGSTRQTGDPQVFYFGIFDGHGGSECSEFLRERLHGYIEEAALLFGLESTLQDNPDGAHAAGGIMGEQDPEDLQKSLVSSWKETVGGYFKRFRPEYFPAVARAEDQEQSPQEEHYHSSIETVLTYAFLKADLDFTTAQAAKHTNAEEERQRKQPSSMDDPVLSDRPLNADDILSNEDRPASQNLRTRPASRGSSPDLNSPIGGTTRFKGGSTASIALVSTPSPTPFWHPNTPSTLIAAHVGDTRILLCRTSDGVAVPLTANHHPSYPVEANRLRRYATSFVTDSFGEERVLGLANTRAFGDIGSKRIGVSAEPQLTTIQLPPAGYAFMVLVSDGVSGHLGDQEIVDVVKEARTPEQAARDLVGFATETVGEADNSTALVVRLGGWERRAEGGGGSLGTRELRDFRRREADDPRRGRM